MLDRVSNPMDDPYCQEILDRIPTKEEWNGIPYNALVIPITRPIMVRYPRKLYVWKSNGRSTVPPDDWKQYNCLWNEEFHVWSITDLFHYQ